MTPNHDGLTVDLVALAVQERFLREWRAGKRPRLSVYARRYPEQAAALADLVASLPPDALPDALPDTIHDATEATEMRPNALPAPLWNGAGAQRALSAIFSATVRTQGDARLPRVAEERAAYAVDDAVDGAHDLSADGDD